MSKTPRPSGPKLDLTSGVPDDPDTGGPSQQELQDQQALFHLEGAAQEAAVDPAEMTLGELLNLSIPSDDPHIMGAITDEQLAPSQVTEAAVTQQPGYSDMINALAGEHGSFTSAINDLAQAGATADPTSLPKAQVKGKAKNIQGGATAPKPPASPAPSAKSSADIKFVSRIRITEAYQYFPQTLSVAPIWVDRNWVGYAGQHDSVRNIEPGPCLRVPDPSQDDRVIVARAGDYVVMQDVVIDDKTSIIEIEVWEREQFERLFMVAMGEKA